MDVLWIIYFTIGSIKKTFKSIHMLHSGNEYKFWQNAWYIAQNNWSGTPKKVIWISIEQINHQDIKFIRRGDQFRGDPEVVSIVEFLNFCRICSSCDHMAADRCWRKNKGRTLVLINYSVLVYMIIYLGSWKG